MGSGTVVQVRHPGATVTEARPARAAGSASAGVDTVTGATIALPPPWITG